MRRSRFPVRASRIRRLVAAPVAAVLLGIAACTAARSDVASTQTAARSTAMNVHRAAVVHTSILVSPKTLTEYLSDLENWKQWAPWVRSVERSSGRTWRLETEAGPMTIQLAEANSFGILDHEVRLASGVTVWNSMRVLPNDTGSELVMVLFQSPPATDEQFERDIQAVTDDLGRIKMAAEALPAGRTKDVP